MKRAIANLLLNAAMSLGAKRVTVQVIQEGYTPATANAVLTRADWHPENAAALDTFLRSGDGQAFANRLHAVAAAVAVNGAQERVHTVHAAGVSAGWNECVRYIFSISRLSGVQDRSLPDGPISGKNGQAPQGEASLLDLLSP